MRKKVIGFALIAMLLALCVPVEAQQPAKIHKIGWLGIGSASSVSRYEEFRRALRELGYVEGKNIAFEYRSADNKLDRLPSLADELVRLQVDLIITRGTPEALALKKATRTIPIVFYDVTDPVGAGLVDSLAQPGGNITGFSGIEAMLAGKRLELLKETVPQGIPRRGVVESAGPKLSATMESKPTASTGAGPAASFHGSQQRGQIRERVQRGS
jgi:putative ABC transport system substrate-binding protein